MKLNRENGVIEFTQGSVGPDTTRRSFLGSPLGLAADVLVRNEPYVTYRIRAEPGLAFTLSFDGQLLSNVAWMIALPPEKEEAWTVEHELERKRIHDAWLLRELGPPPYRYKWGELSSQYDAKGCASDIILSYERSK